MKRTKSTARLGILVVLVITVPICPMAASIVAANNQAFAAESQPPIQISFEPSIAPLELTAIAATEIADTILVPTAVPDPIMVESQDDQYAVAGDLLIGGEAYAIGDEIEDAENIELGATETAPLNGHGYGVIKENPDYRLIWVTGEDGAKRHVIVHKNDPLFKGEDGFSNHIEDVQDGMEALAAAAVPVVTGGLTLVAIGLGACGLTAGGGCVMAAAGALIASIGGIAAEAYIRATVVDPALDNVQADLAVITDNRGINPNK
jgi:hypothetical protein